MERRFWYGVGVLAVLLVLGFWVAWSMKNTHEPIAACLEQAAQAAAAGDMAQGAAFVEKAKAIWQKRRELTAAVADHNPMEEIDSLFAQLESYASAGYGVEFAAWCRRTAQLVAAVGEAQRLTWQNLL